ncbi:MAG: outer membrane lipoprotein-sorting protein [Desulfuromonadaceae bacterium]|nr:outer membrane lipoprotein-sorting protein [Geobacteraceae bacterium]
MRIWLVLPLILIFALPGLALDGEALLREVDRNLNPESYESYRKLINIEPDGRRREYVLFSVKKGSDKMAALFISPASEKGRSTLRVEDNMWLYIPGVGKPIRITSLQSVVGGVFNNSDILRLDYASEYNVTAVEEDGDGYLLHLEAKSRSVAYARVRMWVDMASLLPVRLECLTEKEMLIKRIYFKDVQDFGAGIVRPAVIETDSPLYAGYRSIMLFADIKERDLKDEIFTQSFMPRLDSLR